jgi:hypothetical protein
VRTPKQRRRRVSKEEDRTSRLIGGRKTFASGSGDEKGDGRNMGKWRSENKETDKRSYTIRDEVWERIQAAALSAGERPVMFIRIANRFGKPLRMVVLGEDDFEALREAEEAME